MKAVKKLLACFISVSLIAGTFTGISFSSSAAEPELLEISDSHTANGWYRTWIGNADTERHYIEISAEGCDDIGSLHIVNTTPEGDMRVGFDKAVPAGEYTLKFNIKGSVAYDDQYFYFKESGQPDSSLADLIAKKSYPVWEEVSLPFTSAGGSVFGITVSQYNWATDIYIDNFVLLDSGGNDVLGGLGNFCRDGSDEGETEELLQIYDSETEDYWYRTWIGNADTEKHYMEISAEGCDDIGSLHIVNTEPEGDMRVGFKKHIPAGSYTLKFNIRGSVAYDNQHFYFKESGHDDKLVDLISKKSYPEWEEVSLPFTSAGGNIFGITVSQYNWAADIYIDNFVLLDSDGNDLLGGIGNFDRRVTSEPEEPLPENLLTLYDSFTAGSWYRQWPAGSDTSLRYMEIAGAGCFDNGSLHIKNVAPQGDMYACINKTIPAGKYTLKVNIKGSVGLTTEYFCFTEVGDTSILFDLIDRNEYADWTEVTGTFETNGGTDFLIIFSQYNGITDIYLDNLRIIDENGEDMLEGAGSFCTEPALGEQTDTVLIPSLLSGDSGGFELSLPQYALTGRLKPRDEALYLNGEPAGDIAFCAFADGSARVDYTASDGDVIAFDGVFTDNYYAKYIGPVVFRYADGKWENLLSAEGSEFYFFETLIDNYDFSGGIGGWELNSLPEGSADTLSQTAEGYDGPAMLVTHSAVSGECAYKARTEAYIPVCAGETYLLRFMVRASGNMCLGASLRGNGGTAVACETSGAVITNGTDGWQWMNYRFTLPEDSSLTAVKVQLDNRFSSSDAEVAYDNIAFYRVCPKGDANGDGTSDIKDLIRYKKVMAGVGEYVSPNAADMNGNGYLNVIDMAAFQRHLLGTDDYGPVPYVAVTAPTGTAYPFNETARAYLASGGAPVEDYAVQMNDSAQDIRIVLECPVDGAEFKIEYGTKEDYSDAVSVTTTEKSIGVNNLFRNTVYYVRVTASANGYTKIAESSFKTNDIGPRVMTVGGISNVRDLGGYETSFGRTTVQGIAFRGAQPDEKGVSRLTSQGDRLFSEDIAFRLDMDLRASSENGGISESVIKSAEYANYQITAYAGAFSESQKELYRQVFASYADVNNYPIYLHCVYGADRTATVAYILNALLGVDEKTLIQDYEYTSFSSAGLRSRNNAEMQAFLNGFNALEGSSPAEKAENYLLSIGVTREEIDTIRGIFFGDIPIKR